MNSNQARKKEVVVEPHHFEIILGEDQLHYLNLGGINIRTFAGDQVSHRSHAVIRQIVDELDGRGRIVVDDDKIAEPDFNSTYSILCVQKHMVEAGRYLESNFKCWLSKDPFLHPCVGPEIVDQMSRWGSAFDFLTDVGLESIQLPFGFCGCTVDADGIEKDELEEYREIDKRYSPFASRIQEEFELLLPEEKACLIHLNSVHDGAFIFPLALIFGKCSPNEYANGLIASHGLIAGVFSDVEVEDHQKIFEEFRSHANVVLAYLKAAGVQRLGNRYILNKPVPQEENRFVEFKEVRGKNPVNAIKNTADEYVVSFLNADGGTIIWGIRDSDRVVVGVPLDFQQRDRLRRDVVGKLNEIQPKIDPSQYSLAIYPVVDENGVVEDLHIVEIFVPQREEKTPFFTGGNECFIRTEGSKKKLAGPAFVDWLRIKSISETGI